MSATIWLEPVRGGWRMSGTGRVAGSTWRGVHIYLVRGEAQAALDAAIELAAGATPMVPAASQPASRARRGALTGPSVPSGPGLPGAAGTGVLAVPTPQTLAPGRATHTDYRATRSQATARAERRTLPGWASSPGRDQQDWTRPAARTADRD